MLKYYNSAAACILWAIDSNSLRVEVWMGIMRVACSLIENLETWLDVVLQWMLSCNGQSMEDKQYYKLFCMIESIHSSHRQISWLHKIFKVCGCMCGCAFIDTQQIWKAKEAQVLQCFCFKQQILWALVHWLGNLDPQKLETFLVAP